VAGATKFVITLTLRARAVYDPLERRIASDCARFQRSCETRPDARREAPRALRAAGIASRARSSVTQAKVATKRA